MVDLPPPLLEPGPLARADRALEERLLAAFPAMRFAHDVVPPRFDKTAWNRLTRRTPFVGRGWSRWKAAPGAGRTYRGDASWEIYLVGKNERPANLLRGDALAPGLFSMTQVAMAALHGWTVPGMGTWMLADAAHAYSDEWTDEATGLVALTVSVPLVVDPPDADEFLRLGTTWTHPPIAETTQTVRDPIP